MDVHRAELWYDVRTSRLSNDGKRLAVFSPGCQVTSVTLQEATLEQSCEASALCRH